VRYSFYFHDLFFFFFSSRRRHTRWPRDWSSDVCSSDLFLFERPHARLAVAPHVEKRGALRSAHRLVAVAGVVGGADRADVEGQRSEERRVGKECRSGWWAYD